MKPNIKNRLSVMLAGVLPFMPLVRSALPVMQSPGASTGCIILRWVIGATILGYDAISKASSVAVSPPSATIGVPYSGTLTYSGGHAGAVASMSVNSSCLSSGNYTLAPGLTVHYSGVNSATITGTPTGSATTVGMSVTVYDGGGCSGGLTDTRTTSLIIQNSGGGPVSPTMLVPPQNVTAQIGSDVIFSGGASGNPTPSYYWKLGPTTIPGATQNTLTLHGVSYTNSGIYNLYASNSQGQVNYACCLTTCLTPGSNQLALFYTNYTLGGVTTVISSYFTNVPGANNTYSWAYAVPYATPVSIGVTTSNLTISAATATPAKSGTYAVTFNSTAGSTNEVNAQQYQSFWVFGYPPVVTNQPVSTNVSAGANATLSFVLAGGNYSTVFLYQNQTNLVAQTNLTNNPTFANNTNTISFTLTNVTAANAGTYSFLLTNYWGSTTSSNFSLTVNSPLSVSAPQGQTNYAGKTVTLTANASGTPPFTYQWFDGGSGLSDGGNISGSLTNTLVISPAATNNSGTYQLVVTNAAGAVTSAPAVVSILPIPQLMGASGGGGTVTLNATGGIPGSNYVVVMTSDLSQSNTWTPIATNTIPPGGVISYTATNSAQQAEFYQLVFP
jgi:hypothetical protein